MLIIAFFVGIIFVLTPECPLLGGVPMEWDTMAPFTNDDTYIGLIPWKHQNDKKILLYICL